MQVWFFTSPQSQGTGAHVPTTHCWLSEQEVLLVQFNENDADARQMSTIGISRDRMALDRSRNFKSYFSAALKRQHARTATVMRTGRANPAAPSLRLEGEWKIEIKIRNYFFLPLLLK